MTPPPSATTTIVALEPAADQRLADLFKGAIAFRRLAFVDGDMEMRDAGRIERGLRRLEPVLRHRAVRHDGGARAGTKRGDARAERGDQAAADDDVIGALAERDIDDGRIGAQRRRHHDAAPSAGRRSRP